MRLGGSHQHRCAVHGSGSSLAQISQGTACAARPEEQQAIDSIVELVLYTRFIASKFMVFSFALFGSLTICEDGVRLTFGEELKHVNLSTHDVYGYRRGFPRRIISADIDSGDYLETKIGIEASIDDVARSQPSRNASSICL